MTEQKQPDPYHVIKALEAEVVELRGLIDRMVEQRVNMRIHIADLTQQVEVAQALAE